MRRVLVVDAAEQCRASELLATEGFTVITAHSRHEALESIEALHPELVLLEVDAPHQRAIDVVAALRATTAAPIAMLSGPCAEPDAVAAFSAGVDSLVVGPVGDHELLARLRALLRRVPSRAEVAPDVVIVGPIVLDRGRRELRVNGELVAIPRREFDIAELLMRDAGRVVPRVAIVRELWGSMRDTKSLDVQVGRLRARLAAAEGHRRIVTVRGVGYRFVTDGDLDIEADLDAALDLALDLTAADAAVDPLGELEEPASA